jgi:hypothetical protein
VTPVQLGARLLDERRPGWASEIDLASLDLGSLCDCVLGQLYGSFGHGTDVLVPDADLGHSIQWSRRYGFDREPGVSYVELSDQWRVEIEERNR